MTRFPAGYRIGHATDAARRTGCTVILPPPGTIAAVDVRGGAPGTRETGVFTPGNLVSEIHGLVFAGGSAFGLAAASGVAAWLRERGVGFAVGPARVPIVAGGRSLRPRRRRPRSLPGRGRWATRPATRRGAARSRPGRVGAGTGATVGKLLGVDARAPRRHRRGVRRSSRRGEPSRRSRPSTLSATSWIPTTAGVLAGPRRGGRSLRPPARCARRSSGESPLAGANTTLVCVATTSPSTRARLKRVAIEAHDGLARAVRPAHTVVDGDVVFALAPAGPRRRSADAPARRRRGGGSRGAGDRRCA